MIGIGIEAMTAELEHAQRVRRAEQLGPDLAPAGRPRVAAQLLAVLTRLFRVAATPPPASGRARRAVLSPWCARALPRDSGGGRRRPGRWRACLAARARRRIVDGIRQPAPGERSA